MNFSASSFSARTGFVAAAIISALAISNSCRTSAQRLPTSVIPTHYTLKLTPDLKAATFTCEEAIDVNIAAPTHSITLNAIEIAFQSVTIFPNGPEQTGTVSLDASKQQATLNFPKTVPAGNATIKIRYTGILNNELRGFYLSKTARRNYAVTQFEATDARRAFPCFDEPAFKATYDISLVIDASDTAISNTPIVADTPGPGTAKHTLVFATTPKMSTYLVAFLVGDFQCTGASVDDVDLRVCATPDKVSLTPFALDVAKFALHYYDDYFGIHYPLKKLDLVGIPDFEAGAMENFGAITFRESDLLVDQKTAPVSVQRNAAIDVTHEMAHQWFGDLVTMQWWDNIWLNEGFATWMENKPLAAMHPDWNMPELVASEEQDTLDTDAQPTTRAIRARANTPDEIDEMFDDIAYGKASDVLLTVENYLGAETFRKGVHAYLTAHEYGNATAEDFWNAETLASRQPVDKIMQSLIVQQGEPILSFGTPESGRVSVEQDRFYLDPIARLEIVQKWTLPVCFKAGADLHACDLLEPVSRALSVPASPLFFANAGGAGYYRTAYTHDDFVQLKTHAESTLTAPERISLLGDTWALAHANRLPIGDYLDLAAALKSDSNAEVISRIAGKIGTIAEALAATKEERDGLAAWIRHDYAPEYAKLGPSAPGDSPNTLELRAELLSLLANQGEDADVMAQARKIADKFLDDPASVDPALGQAALQAAAKNGDSRLFNRLQSAYEASSDPAIQENALRLLVQFDDPALLERGLEYSISNKVRNQDAAIQLRIGLRTPENRNATWQFIKTHWDAVQADLTTDLGAYMVSGTGSFCSDADRDDVKSFFAAHPVPASAVALKHAIESIDGCVELRRLQEPNLKKWLSTQGGH
ncbi:MAG TPA: M1 family metallopeptidase [Terracidiphilus sp.]|nr:M1 family metallopeptidase [Terracidiphilus sp.]